MRLTRSKGFSFIRNNDGVMDDQNMDNRIDSNDYIVHSAGKDQMDLGSVKGSSQIREKIVGLIPTD